MAFVSVAACNVRDPTTSKGWETHTTLREVRGRSGSVRRYKLFFQPAGFRSLLLPFTFFETSRSPS